MPSQNPLPPINKQLEALFSGSNLLINGLSVVVHNPEPISDTWQNGWKMLCENIAHGAIHNQTARNDPPKCHEGTRVAVLRRIVEWVQDFTAIQVFMWMYGPAGAGKSAIAGSVADLCRTMNIWTVSFFFSRHTAERNNDTHFATTLSYQICTLIPEMRRIVGAAIDNNPAILNYSLSEQMKMLITDPIKEVLTMRPRLSAAYIFIIIGGLDELGDRENQKRILNALLASESQFKIPTVFLIASRPELEIREWFNSTPLQRLTIGLSLDDEYQANEDIYILLKDSFDNIKVTHTLRRHLYQSWPGQDILHFLVQRSSGQFIYASTVVKYIQSSRHRPDERLNIIMGLHAINHGDNPFAVLDALYFQILASVHDLDRVMEILSYLTLYDPEYELDDTKKTISEQLLYGNGDIDIILCDMHALLRIPEEETQSIDFYHVSFSDYLSDRSRSGSFFLDPVVGHTMLACKVVELIKQKHDYLRLENEFGILIHHLEHATLSPSTSDLGNHLHVDLLSIILKHPEQQEAFQYWYHLKELLKSIEIGSDAGSATAHSLLCYYHGIEDIWLVPKLQMLHPETLSALVAYLALKLPPLENIEVLSDILETTEIGRWHGNANFSLKKMLKLFLQTEIPDPQLSVMEFRCSVIQDFVLDNERSGPYFDLNDEKYTILCQRLVDWVFQKKDRFLNSLRTIRAHRVYNAWGPMEDCLVRLKHALPKAMCNTMLAETLKEVALVVLWPRYNSSTSPEVRARTGVALASLEYVKRCNVSYLEHRHPGHVAYCAICGDRNKTPAHDGVTNDSPMIHP